MPRFPEFADRLQGIQGSVFEKYRHRMQAQGDRLVRLHIGDTYLPPVYPLPIQESFKNLYPVWNRYCNTFGVGRLRTVLAQKLAEDNHLAVTEDHILVTSGATNALSVAVHSLVNPGEAVLTLTPCWPFFMGMVRMAGGEVIELPFYDRLNALNSPSITDYLENAITEQVVAIYVNSPNNPSGVVLTAEQLAEIARVAQRHRLWIISDEAYDGLTFPPHQHISIATLEGVGEQTISIFTFSKIFMYAGLRLGYLVATPEVVTEFNKTLVHQLYSPSTTAQYMMIEPVQTRHQWMPGVRDHYQTLRDLMLEHLHFPVPTPGGTYFLFFSLEPFLNGRSFQQVFETLLDSGVSVAPGSDFGRHYQQFIRLCFTGEPPERLKVAADRLNRVLLESV